MEYVENMERVKIVESVYSHFSRTPHTKWVEEIVRGTMTLDIVSLIAACDAVKTGTRFPENVTGAIWGAIRERRQQEHNATKNTDMFKAASEYSPACGRFLQMVAKSFILARERFAVSYDEFWKEINDTWGRAEDEARKNAAIDYAEQWFNYIVKNQEVKSEQAMAL